MRKIVLLLSVLFLLFVIAARSGQGQNGGRDMSSAQMEQARPPQPLPAPFPLDDAYLEWPLPPADKAYHGSIDGRHIHQYVSQLATIADQYRDQGHQLWGRITGTSGDVAGQQWLIDNFKRIGLTDVHSQEFDLAPQWLAQSWDVTATGSGKTLHLETAQPVSGITGTPPECLDLEAVYAGLGSEADFAGKDVRGKAAFVFSAALPAMCGTTAQQRKGASKRANPEEKGAAVIFDVILSPGNTKFELYPTGNKIPTFALGMGDGYAMREAIEQAPAGQPPVM